MTFKKKWKILGLLKVCEDSGQAERKTAGFENRSGAYLKYVSTGSAGNRYSQAGLTSISA